jgi:hypothetical protein
MYVSSERFLQALNDTLESMGKPKLEVPKDKNGQPKILRRSTRTFTLCSNGDIKIDDVLIHKGTVL